MDKWQPIESAPRDGSWFVTMNANCADEFEVGRYFPQQWRSYEPAGDGLFRAVDTEYKEFSHDNFHRATHWVGLPPLAATGATDEC